MKILIFNIFIIYSIINAQGLASINGFIRDNETGEPISYANVFISNTVIGATSNQDGYFVISKVPLGSYEFNVSMIGFKIHKEKVTINDKKNIRLEIRLEKEVIETSEVLVTAERQKFERSMASSQISLDYREISSAPAFVEPDVFRTLQMLPGVQTSSDFSSALYVRGSTPDQNLIMLDGITIYNPYHLGGIFSTFNTNSIKEADFHAGGFPARYGGRMGAILNVLNREGNTQKIEGEFNISLISSKALLEGPIKYKSMKGSWIISGRRTYIDQLLKNVFTFPYYFYDYQIKANLDLNLNNRLTYTRFYGDDVLNYSYSSQNEYSNDNENIQIVDEDNFSIDWPWGNYTNGITWRWIISPAVVAKTFMSNSRYRFDFGLNFRDGTTFNYADSTAKIFTDVGVNYFNKIQDNTLETELSWNLNKNHIILAGFQVKDIQFKLGLTYDYSTNDTALVIRPLDIANRTREISLFIQDKWSLSEKIKMQLGTRFTNYNLHSKLYIDPRASFKYHITKNVSFKFNWGIYHQFLTTANNQDQNLRLVDLWMGIPKSKPASVSQHTIAGFEYLSPKNILFRLEIYNKGFDNLLTIKQGEIIAEDNNEVTSTTSFNEFWDTDAEAYGLEILIKKSSGKLNGWIGYTRASANYFTPQSGWHPPNFDRTHTLNAVGNIQISQDLELSSSVTYSSGNPYTKILGRSYNWQQDLSIDNQYLSYDSFIVGEKNAERYEEYFRVDIGITRKGGNLFGIEYDTYWQIMNVTKHLNVFGYTTRTKIDRYGNRIGVEQRSVNMFPLIVTFGVNVEI